MLRATAYQLLTKYLTNPVLVQHSLFVEAVMRVLAPRFAGDSEEWRIAGLLHDADYEKAKSHPEKHGLLLTKLEPNTIPSTIEHALAAHNYEWTKVMPTTSMDWALVCCDELTSIIFELAQVQTNKKSTPTGQGIAMLTTEQVLLALKDVHFAKDAKKDHILLCEEKLGIPLVEFVAIILSAMQNVNFQPSTH